MVAHSSIHSLIRAGDIWGVCNHLMRHPHSIDDRNELNNLPIHTACLEKQVQLIGVLIDAGARVNERGYRGRTPLHLAVQDGDVSSLAIVVELLNAGADPTLQDDAGFSVLDWAENQMVICSPDVLKLIREKNSSLG